MGATFFIGCSKDKELYVTLNRGASDAIEILLDEVLKGEYINIHESITEMSVLDQLNFCNLSKTDFNFVINAVKKYLDSQVDPTEGQVIQHRLWEEDILPLMKQDERYQSIC
ncbi:hypothetical protein LH23_20035 [Cedecea neteri]|uniref:Uncharacterized protein n=1 Tax=Cedecea neteri TaxID=158822 RepID=A0AAN0S7S8_9ENTR|nr:hypothetical protein [Cedecea neteri]AIR62864.1 hypothetical protein LH23_20035 [Cedecea neteri]